MSVKNQIIITMVITVILVATSVLVSNIVLFSRFVDSNFENSLERATLEVLNEISILENNVAHLAAIYFANDPILINAIETGNNDALIGRTDELFVETGIELFTVTDIRGRVIAQPHSPDFVAFYLTAMRSVRHALMGGVPVTTVEGGSAVNLMVSASSPIFGTYGEVIGAVLVGFRLDTNEFVDRHRHITGAEVAIFRGTEVIVTTLENQNGQRAIGAEAPEDIRQTVIFGGETFLGELTFLEQNMIVKATPIFDAYGNVVATLFIGHHLTEKASVVQSFIITGALLSALFLVISTLIIRFISERIANPISKKLDQLHLDALTGIHNRRYFDEKLVQMIEPLSRSDVMISLAMIDIDYFKRYNDVYGHGEGDRCLKMVANALTKTVVRNGDFVARYGGEEFVAVFPNTDEAGAHVVAQKLVEGVYNLNIPHRENEASDRVTASVGIVTIHAKHIESIDKLVKHADELLYKSKQNDRNRYTHGNIRPPT
ncbi:MAG: diguanylate cyclase [Defluviitaleaceae bacterium]|nr:diguanylate cyclase [Defluviitaleaceae bacterium]